MTRDRIVRLVSRACSGLPGTVPAVFSSRHPPDITNKILPALLPGTCRTDDRHDRIPGRADRNRRSGSRVFVITGLILLAVLVLLPVAVFGVDCDDVTGSPIVDFEYIIDPSETAPIAVNFFSTSQSGRNSKGVLSDPVESYLWRFGDGQMSEEPGPVHSYATSSARYQAPPQPFDVTLTVKTRCERSNTTTKKVSVYCIDPLAGFRIVRPVGEGPYPAPVALVIQDTSVHVADAVTTYHYTLWDSGMTSLFLESPEKDPVFVISNSGSFVLRQEVFKACSNASYPGTEMTKKIEVTGSGTSGSTMIPLLTVPATAPASPATAATTISPSMTTAPALQPAGAIPGTGTLSVVTSPAGARVFVNGVLLGSSPVTIPGLAAGSYILRLEKNGYRNMTVPVEIGEAGTTEYSGALEAESAGTWIVPVIAALVIIAAGAGAVYWYVKKKGPKKPEAVDFLHFPDED